MKRDLTVRLDARKNDKFQITSQGFLVADANLTRAGVFDYFEDGKLVRELRPPEEVFKKESLDSLKFAPLTKFHPDKMVDSENAKFLQVGMIGENIEKRGDFVGGKVVITDKKEIDEILAKWDKGESIELSMGYDAEVDELVGTHHKDGNYEKVQRNIVYNHGSIVPNGRAGREVKLIMDAEEEAIKSLNDKKDTEVKMFKFKKDAITVGGFKMDSIMEDVDESAKGVVETLSARVDEAVNIISTVTKEKESIQAKHDELEATNKEFKAKVDELSDPTSGTVQAMIKSRADIEAVAKDVEVKTDSEDGKVKDSKSLKIDIITKIHPEFKADGKSDDYISARYDSVVDFIKAAKEGKAAESLAGFRKDAAHASGKEKKDAREKFLEETKNYHDKK